MDISTATSLPAAQTLLVNEVPVTYYEAGTGQTIVLLHGWPQTSHIWRKVFPELARDYHVLAIDLPGMGNTHPTASADTQTVAGLLKSFFDLRQLERVNLVGHDIGAWVAVAFALEYEETLQSLTVMDAGIPGLMPAELFSPANAGKIWQFYFHGVHDIPEFLIQGKEKEYFTWYFTNKSAVKTAITSDDIQLYSNAYTGRELLSNGFAYYRAFSESASQNTRHQHQLKIPVLAIGGEQAQGLNMGATMNKICQNVVTAVSIPDCGHYVAEEQPGEFLRLMREFLPPAR